MKRVTLSVDIGNTQISLGFFSCDEIIERFDYPTYHFEIDPFIEAVQKFIESSSIKGKKVVGGMIGSVVPRITRLIQIALKTLFSVELDIFKTSDNKIVKLDVDSPEEVGADLVADLVASSKLYGYPAVIVDLGTLTKNMVLDKNGTFIGTSFFPGLQVCMDAMSEKAELIPDIKEVSFPKGFLGKNTYDAMNSGMYYVTASAIIKLGEMGTDVFGKDTKLILTGGYSPLMCKYIKNWICDPNLALKGLNILARK